MAARRAHRTPPVKADDAEQEMAKADMRAALQQSLAPTNEAVEAETRPDPRPVEETLDPTEEGADKRN